MELKQKYTILMLLSILLTVVLIMWGDNLTKSRIKRIKKIDKKIKAQQEKLNSAKVLNNQLQQVSKVIKNSITTEEHFSAEEVNDFVEQLAQIADEYKIAVAGVIPKETFTNSNRTLLEEKYSLELQSTYVQLGMFLSRLESLDHILKVKTLDVRPASANNDVVLDNSNETLYRVILELVCNKIKKEA
jgi:Tfp pilus assembly protein PilO